MLYRDCIQQVLESFPWRYQHYVGLNLNVILLPSDVHQLKTYNIIKWRLNVSNKKKKPYNPPVTIINWDPADTDKSVLAEILAFLKKLDPCCKSIISPFNLFSKQSISATSLDTCCHVVQKFSYVLLSIIYVISNTNYLS